LVLIQFRIALLPFLRKSSVAHLISEFEILWTTCFGWILRADYALRMTASFEVTGVCRMCCDDAISEQTQKSPAMSRALLLA